jgi:zinc protease
MNKHCVRAIFAVLVFILATTAVREAYAGAEEFTVNGLNIILKSNSANEIISAQLYVRGGALNLTEETQGIESLLFASAVRGTQKYPRDVINGIFDRTAAGVSSNAGRDYSVVTLRCLTSDFNELWDVFADVVMHPALVAQDVDVVRQNLLLQLKQQKDNPDAYLNDLAIQAFYAGHPYRLNPAGTEASLAAISIDQMKAYLADHLQTSRLLLVVVGNVSKGDLEKKVTATFGALPKGSYAPQRPGSSPHAGPTLKVVERDMPTNYITGLFTAPAPEDPDYFPMAVTMNILGTRVWEEVRTKRNLSYAPGAGLNNQFSNYGSLYVTAVKPDTTIKVMLAEVKKLQTEPVTASDLRDRITLFLTGYYRRNETNAAQAQFLAWNELSGLGWKAGDNYIATIRKVTAQDVMRVANKYIHNIQFVILGNPKLVDEKTFSTQL